MFQFLRTAAVRFGKNRLYVSNVLNLAVLDLFLVIDHLIQAYQFFLIAHQQGSDRNLASKIFLSVPMNNGRNLAWLIRFSLFKVFGYMVCFLTILNALS